MSNCSALIKNGKWYDYPEIYAMFSESEDKDKIAINIVLKYINEHQININNPVDLGSGTGKLYDQLFKNINFNGKIHLVESNAKMVNYLNEKYNNKVEILNTSIKNFKLDNNSNFIISSFGFPSKLFDKRNCLEELKNVVNNMSDDGILITLGWNEKWNDELSTLWKKYITDNSIYQLASPRNCNLSWYINNIETKLKFDNIKQRDYILECFFRKDAKKEYQNTSKLEWNMLMGITINNKQQLEDIIKEMEK